MKKILSLTIVAALIMSLLVGCSNNKPGKDEDKPSTTKPSSTQGASLQGDLSKIIDEIYKKKSPDLSLQTLPVDLSDKDAVKAFTGLTDVSKVKEASASEAMIGSQAYSLVLVRVKDSKDAEAVANDMKKGIDQRKWICVEADDLRVVAYQDVVMLMMVSTDLADTVTADQIVDAFKSVCGGSLTVDLKK